VCIRVRLSRASVAGETPALPLACAPCAAGTECLPACLSRAYVFELVDEIEEQVNELDDIIPTIKSTVVKMNEKLDEFTPKLQATVTNMLQNITAAQTWSRRRRPRRIW
jgi:hypothetical protein